MSKTKTTTRPTDRPKGFGNHFLGCECNTCAGLRRKADLASVPGLRARIAELESQGATDYEKRIEDLKKMIEEGDLKWATQAGTLQDSLKAITAERDGLSVQLTQAHRWLNDLRCAVPELIGATDATHETVLAEIEGYVARHNQFRRESTGLRAESDGLRAEIQLLTNEVSLQTNRADAASTSLTLTEQRLAEVRRANKSAQEVTAGLKDSINRANLRTDEAREALTPYKRYMMATSPLVVAGALWLLLVQLPLFLRWIGGSR